MKTNKVLVFGIGNSGRADDGLGWAFLDEIGKLMPEYFDLEYRYQLQIEDAELASHYEQIYFVDAHKTPLKEGFSIENCSAVETHHFTTHELPPKTILYLTNKMYHSFPNASIIGISGENFELKIGLSLFAKTNLIKALKQFTGKVCFKQKKEAIL